MDYRGLGFRECLAETARYLSIMEGLDGADPLRIRLVSHLNSYAMQREAHSGLGHLGWGSAFGTPPPHLPPHLLMQPPPPPGVVMARSTGSPSSSSSSSSSSSASPPASSSSSSSSSLSSTTPSSPPSYSDGPLLSGRLGGGMPMPDGGAQTVPLRVPPVLLPGSPPTPSKLAPHLLTSLSGLSAFPFPLGAFPLLSPRALSPSTGSASLGKPYRPWSMEIGAF